MVFPDWHTTLRRRASSIGPFQGQSASSGLPRKAYAIEKLPFILHAVATVAGSANGVSGGLISTPSKTIESKKSIVQDFLSGVHKSGCAMDVLQLKAREARKPIVIVKSGHRQPTTSAMDDIAFRHGATVPRYCTQEDPSYRRNQLPCDENPEIYFLTLNRSDSLLFDTTGVSGSQRNYIMRFRPGILATGEPELRSPSAAASCNQGDRDIMRKNLNFLALCHPFTARAWRTGPGI
uniref:Uncharacterized protein n=1 Tax=Coccidioides posadasii RMSCC 3488 TaxID=454284 RepID=A0A0J6FQB5_COCPO|nr:hypothetical protein CPAG_07486 [Coccidioides posadasii RMSCC 3488]